MNGLRAALLRRRGTPQWDAVLRGSGAVALAALYPALRYPEVSGLTAFLMVTVFVNGPLAPLLPATYEPILVAAGRVWHWSLVASLGICGILYVEYLNYHLYRAAIMHPKLESARASRLVQTTVALFKRSPFFTVWLCSWSPLPYWAVRFLAPLSGYPVRPYLWATFLGRFPRLCFFAALGAVVPLSNFALLAASAVMIAFAVAIAAYRRARVAAVAALLACVIAREPLAARQLSPVETRIASAVDAGVPDAIALLERIVNINSGTMNLAGVRAVGRALEPEFTRLGFVVRWVDGTPWGRAGHLVATRRGSGRGPRVLLIGHLDTVFEEDSPFQRWERLTDSTARGPGATDMKGGNVVMLLALRALERAGRLDALQLTVVLTGDEENAGAPISLARADLVAAAQWADVAIGFEDGDGDPATAVIGRRGSSNWVLRTSGVPSHSSQVFTPPVGSGAIFEAARILASFHDSLAGEQNLTFNPGFIVGGTTVTFDREAARGTAFGKSNVVAESAAVFGDLRTLSIAQLRRAQERMRAITARNLPRTGASIEFEDRYPPLAPSEGNLRLLALLDRASRDLGLGPVSAADPARAGAADVSFTAGLVDMAIDGVGLMGRGGHTVNETADLRSLPLNAKRVAVLLQRLAAAASGI